MIAEPRQLYALVEGPTERLFFEKVLSFHLQLHNITASPRIVRTRRDKALGRQYKGGNQWSKVEADLHRLLKEHPGPDARFTTMFDLYALDRDFPGAADAVPDGYPRARHIEASLARHFNDPRLLPYIQLYELETLVLVGLHHLEAITADRELPNLRALRQSIAGIPFESINGGRDTAPSKRLEAAITYSKTEAGIEVIGSVGVPALCDACPHFKEWITALEGLGQQDAAVDTAIDM